MPKTDVMTRCRTSSALAPGWERATNTPYDPGWHLTDISSTIYVLISVRTGLQHFRAVAGRRYFPA